MRHETPGKRRASTRGRLALTCPGGFRGLDHLPTRPEEGLDDALLGATMIAEGRVFLSPSHSIVRIWL
jgi:hypothetical protein